MKGHPLFQFLELVLPVKLQSAILLIRLDYRLQTEFYFFFSYLLFSLNVVNELLRSSKTFTIPSIPFSRGRSAPALLRFIAKSR